MTIKLLRLLIITGDGWLENERNSIVANVGQHLDNIQLERDNLYLCSIDSLKFLLHFETRHRRGDNAIILKPIISDQGKLDADEINLAPYIKILLKIIEDYEIYSLKSVDSDSVGLPE